MLPRWILSFSWSWTPVFVFQGLWSDFKNTMLPILVTKPNLGPVTHTDHLICLLRNLCAGQEATVITGHGTTDCFQIWKGIHQGWILSTCLFNNMQNTSWDMLGYMKHSRNQDCWEKYQSLWMCRWHHPDGSKWRRTKETFDESERWEWKCWLKAQHSEN